MVKGSCAWLQCRNNCKYTRRPDIAFFSFPVTAERRWKWIVNLGRTDLLEFREETLRNLRVCEDHFEDFYIWGSRNYRKCLVPNAVPTIFDHSIDEQHVPELNTQWERLRNERKDGVLWKKTHNSTKQPIKCQYCPETCTSMEDMLIHYNINHKNECNLSANIKNKIEHKCKYCRLIFKSQSRLLHHQILTHEEFTQNSNNEIFTDIAYIRNIGMYRCSDCNKLIEGLRNFQGHNRVLHGSKAIAKKLINSDEKSCDSREELCNSVTEYLGKRAEAEERLSLNKTVSKEEVEAQKCIYWQKRLKHNINMGRAEYSECTEGNVVINVSTGLNDKDRNMATEQSSSSVENCDKMVVDEIEEVYNSSDEIEEVYNSSAKDISETTGLALTIKKKGRGGVKTMKFVISHPKLNLQKRTKEKVVVMKKGKEVSKLFESLLQSLQKEKK